MNKFAIIDLYSYKDKKYLKKIIRKCLKEEKVKNANFTIIFIDDEKMHELNKKYRGVDRSTDVLSFAFEDNNKVWYNTRMLGEIYISIPKMKEQALEYGHSEKRELAFLVIHGLLHLLGYDHELGKKEEKEMFEKQELILNGFKETKKRT
ncbi:MAG: rRNA maturation RNase YbeY [Firmicutes bacterium]|nr:rRNA maturation RNase YbeY [Bacillota bacterium]